MQKSVRVVQSKELMLVSVHCASVSTEVGAEVGAGVDAVISAGFLASPCCVEKLLI